MIGALAALAISQMAAQLDAHPLFLLGELHRWQELHAIVQELLHDPSFICRADDVVLEAGNSRLQKLADAWVAGAQLGEAELQSMWRETAVPLTWNSPLYRRVYEAVRDINQQHLCPHPVRLVLGDGPIDWSKVRSASDFAPWGERDALLAETIEREVLARHRRAFVLLGLAHVLKAGAPVEAATAELLERRHPGAVFAVAPVRTAEDARALQMGAAPSFRLMRDSAADFRLIWKSDPEWQWPPLGEVVDALAWVGPQLTMVYPSPAIYLEPDYLRELRRRAAIIRAYSGQDFTTVIDQLVKEASGK